MKPALVLLVIMALGILISCTPYDIFMAGTVSIDVKASGTSISVSPAKVKVEKDKDGIAEIPLEYNAKSVIVSVVYPDKETTDIDTKLVYLPLPAGWTPAYLSESNSIFITPNKDLPIRWEFDLKFEPKEQGFVGVAALQRWLITMR